MVLFTKAKAAGERGHQRTIQMCSQQLLPLVQLYSQHSLEVYVQAKGETSKVFELEQEVQHLKDLIYTTATAERDAEQAHEPTPLGETSPL
jgi:hypothetical protein